MKKWIIKLTGLLCLWAGVAHADINSYMANFWNRTGGGANYTPPQSYLGQQGGFISGGSLYVRTAPRNVNLAQIQLPSIRAGCGGIDVFGGSFSFISKEELIKLMEGIMQNAMGFAFELALESMSPAVQETVSKLRDLIQKVNASTINSCEAGQALVASIWPTQSAAQDTLCSTIGTMQGFYQDWLDSRHNCGTGGQNAATLAQAQGALAEQVPTDVNYAWRAILKNAYLSSDRALAEVFMTMTGTIITTAPPNDNQGPTHRTILPRAFSPEMVQAFIEGGTIEVLRCDEASKCLNPAYANLTIPAASGFYARVNAIIAGLADAIRTDSTPPATAAALVGMTATPVYKTLVTAASYKHQFVDDEITQMSELVAIEFAMRYIQEALDEMQRSAANTDAFGNDIGTFKESVQRTLDSFGVYRQDAYERYAQALTTINKLVLTQEALTGQTASRFSQSVLN